MYFISVTIQNRQTELRQSLEKYHLWKNGLKTSMYYLI